MVVVVARSSYWGVGRRRSWWWCHYSRQSQKAQEHSRKVHCKLLFNRPGIRHTTYKFNTTLAALIVDVRLAACLWWAPPHSNVSMFHSNVFTRALPTLFALPPLHLHLHIQPHPHPLSPLLLLLITLHAFPIITVTASLWTKAVLEQ